MATRIERILAAIDRWFGHNDGFGNGEYIHTKNFYSDHGRKMAIINADGSVHALGNSWWVVHRYDAEGNLISRTRKFKTLEKGQRLICGQRACDNAYRNQPDRYAGASGSGMA